MINLEFPTLNLKETGNRIKALRVNSGYTVEDIAGYMHLADSLELVLIRYSSATASILLFYEENV